MSNNRELSQFGNFIEVNDSSRHIGIASAAEQFVGIGIDDPTEKLHVTGNALISNNLNVSGVGTIPTFYSSSGSINYLGFSTAVGNDVISSKATFSDLQSTNINSSGISTLGNVSVNTLQITDSVSGGALNVNNVNISQNLNVTNNTTIGSNLNVGGIGTIPTFFSSNATIGNLGVSTITSTNLTAVNGNIQNIQNVNINSTGISTLGDVISNSIVSNNGSINDLSGTFLNYTGISTLSGIKYPETDGIRGQVILTDGQGNLEFGVGGNSFYENRIYVSEKTGDDSFDGKILPVRTIKRASEIASKESEPTSIYIETGEYKENNPIILYEDISVVGDTLRGVTVIPLNAGQDMFKVRNGCYITNLSLKDYTTDNVPQFTFTNGFAFDDVDDSTYSRVGYAGEEVNIQNVIFDNTTGITTITTASPHFLRYGSTVRLSGIAFTCGYDEVGISTFSYDNTTGLSTAVTTSPHGLEIGDLVYLNGLEFSCDSQYVGLTTTIFPYEGQPGGVVFTVTGVTTATNTFTFVAGISTITHVYESGGTTQKVLIYPESNASGYIDFPVVSAASSTELTIRAGITTVSHYYTQGGTLKIGKPLITRSPYIQNCSLISFLGANGGYVDGSKVITPNTPVIQEEAERPAAGDAPEQGKSMVANAFTVVSFGGIGWRTINDGYTQLVSCFQIFNEKGSTAESGGYISITNSATNFGNFALFGTGFSPRSYRFDRGIVVEEGLDDVKQKMKVIGLGRSDQEFYVLRFFDQQINDKTGLFKPTGITTQFDGISGINTVTNEITVPNHGFDNGDSVIYFASPSGSIGNLKDVNQYYVSIVNSSTIKIYEDSSLTVVKNLTPKVGIHTFKKSNVEFFLERTLDSNNRYQELTLDSSSYTFVPGRLVQQPTTGASGYVLSYDSDKLIVSNDGVVDFNTGQIQDHAVSPANATINGFVGISTYYTVEFIVGSTESGLTIQNIENLPENYFCHFHKPSIVNSSSHTWEFAGSGTDYNALPENGGQRDPAKEQVEQKAGRVYTSGTNELGDFKIGNVITAFNRTGNIIFNNTVQIGELTSIRFIVGNSPEITGISSDVGLGENEVGGPQDFRLSTQKAIRTFLNNRLGNFIDKNISTSSVPNSVVLLNSGGTLNRELIPPQRPVNSYYTTVGGGRTSLVDSDIPSVDILGGDIVVEDTGITTATSYQLFNDKDSQYLVLSDSTRDYNYLQGDVIRSSSNEAVGIVTIPTNTGYGSTGLVKGVLSSVVLSSGGSGYTPGIYTNVSVATSTGIGSFARADVVVDSTGDVSQVNLTFGGSKYELNDILEITSVPISGSNYASLTVSSVETRLYAKLTNNTKFNASIGSPDFIEDRDAVGLTTTLNSTNIDLVNNTITVSSHGYDNGDALKFSASNPPSGLTSNAFYYVGSATTNNFTLHTNRTDSLTIVSGISTNTVSLGSTGSGTATFTKQNVRINDVINTSSTNSNNYIVVSTNDIDASNIVSGIISPDRLGSDSATSDTFLSGDSSFKKVVQGISIASTESFIVNGSAGFTTSPGITTYYGNVNLALSRVDFNNSPTDEYGNLGIARFKKSTFAIAANGAVRIKSSSESGDVDAATLGGQSGSYYTNPDNLVGSIPITKGGTGLITLPSLGSILVGTGSGYSITTNPSIAGSVSAASASIPLIFTTNLVSQNINNTGGIGTISNLSSTNATINFTTGTNANYTGIVTALRFVGDGSTLTGTGSTVVDDTASNQTLYPLFTSQTSGTVTASRVSTTKLTFNPFLGSLSTINLSSQSLNNTGIGTIVTLSSSTANIGFISGDSANYTGIVTALRFVGDGSTLTGTGSTVVDDTTTNSSFYPLFTAQSSGTVTASRVSTTKLIFNPSTGTLTSTDFNTTSDQNYKENIETVNNSLEILNQIRGVKFTWKDNKKQSLGVIAQEIEKILPELVNTEDDKKSVNYNGLIAVLIESIKELNNKVETLESELKNLKKQ